MSKDEFGIPEDEFGDQEVDRAEQRGFGCGCLVAIVTVLLGLYIARNATDPF